MILSWLKKRHTGKAEQLFFLKKGYKDRHEPLYFADELVRNEGLVHQPYVYPFAAYLAERFACSCLVDFGCGRAHKLAGLSDKFKVLGVDYGNNIDYCRKKYAFGHWIDWDFEKNEIVPVPSRTAQYSVVICSDLIEHLVDPRPLIDNLKHILDFTPVAVLTTPDRDLVRGANNYGPPGNPHHVREWNLIELQALLTHFDIGIEFMGLTVNNNVDMEKKQ